MKIILYLFSILIILQICILIKKEKFMFKWLVENKEVVWRVVLFVAGLVGGASAKPTVDYITPSEVTQTTFKECKCQEVEVVNTPDVEPEEKTTEPVPSVRVKE